MHNPDFRSSVVSQAFFDAYVVNIDTKDAENTAILFLDWICKDLDLDFEPCSPKFGYRAAYRFFRGDLSHGLLQFGGDHVGSGIYISFQGSCSPRFFSWVQGVGFSYRLLRADIAIDFEGDIFNSLARTMQDVIGERRLSSSVAGDWVNSFGRTLYTGSRQSIAFGRIYEKWIQLDLPESMAFSRFEVEFKPHKNDRSRVVSFSPADFLASSPWVVDFLNRLFSGSIVARSALSRPSGRSDHDKAFSHLVYQYRSTIRHELRNLQGDYEALLNKLLFDDVDKLETSGYSLGTF